MLEAGVPIDHVGGASIGASVAASFAMGWDWDTMLEWERYATVDRGSLIDFSFPAVALARGEKLTSAMQRAYGDTHIEDLWADYFSVSTDLTAGRLRVHDCGPVWQAIRASVAIPGIFPPVRASDGHVLVDGGVLNNLPTDVMRDRYRPATVIAVDLQGSLDIPSSDLNGDGIVSGWRVVGRRFAPWKTPMAVPRMVDVLSRATALTGSQSAEYADLVLRPPVDGVGVLDFSDYRRVVDAGYHHAIEILENWDGVRPGVGDTT
jgi:predicted acylesterase/phospholipase RssA